VGRLFEEDTQVDNKRQSQLLLHIVWFNATSFSWTKSYNFFWISLVWWWFFLCRNMLHSPFRNDI